MPAEKPANGNGNGGALDWLRARHDAIIADRTLDVAVPGYENRLILRCGPVPWATVNRIQPLLEKNDREGSHALNAQADVVISACREVLVRGDDGELAGIDPSGPRRIDATLAELLHIEATTARQTLLWLFGDNGIALAVCAGRIMEWSQDTSADVEEALASE
jgi:hypothetical protein